MIAQDYEPSAQWTVTSRPSQWTGGQSQKTSTFSHPSESSSKASELLLNDTSDPPALEQADWVYALRNPQSPDLHGVDTISFNDLKHRSGSEDVPPFLFVTYEFTTFDFTVFDTTKKNNRAILHRIAEERARQMGLLGYWGIGEHWHLPHRVRSKSWGLADVVKAAKQILFIFHEDLSSPHRRFPTDNEEVARPHLENWIQQAIHVPVFVASIQRDSFFVHLIDTDLQRSVDMELTQKVVQHLLWNHKAGTPQATKFFIEKVALDDQIPTQFPALLSLLELLGMISVYSTEIFFQLIEDFLPVKTNEPRRESEFEIFATILLMNKQVQLLERWLCIKEWQTPDTWDLESLLKKTGHWLQTVQIRPLCRAIGLGAHYNILVDGTWGHSINLFKLPNGGRMSMALSKWTSRAVRTGNRRFLAISGAHRVDRLNTCIPGLEANRLRLDSFANRPLLEQTWTLVDMKTNTVVYFVAQAEPTHIVVCAQRDVESWTALVCSSESRKRGTSQTDGSKLVASNDRTGSGSSRSRIYYKEDVVELDSRTLDGLQEMGRIEISLRSKQSPRRLNRSMGVSHNPYTLWDDVSQV